MLYIHIYADIVKCNIESGCEETDDDILDDQMTDDDYALVLIHRFVTGAS